jgi:hypothetical protein
MAIRRAGPWATTTDSFVNAPDDFDTEPSQSPVNCALNDWTNDPWKALFVKADFATFDSAGIAELGEVITQSGAAFGNLALSFYYQATQGFDVNFNYSITATGQDPWSWDWSFSTIEGESGSDEGFGAGSSSATEIISLPSSTLGRLTVQVFGQGVDSTSVSIS